MSSELYMDEAIVVFSITIRTPRDGAPDLRSSQCAWYLSAPCLRVFIIRFIFFSANFVCWHFDYLSLLIISVEDSPLIALSLSLKRSNPPYSHSIALPFWLTTTTKHHYHNEMRLLLWLLTHSWSILVANAILLLPTHINHIDGIYTCTMLRTSFHPLFSAT